MNKILFICKANVGRSQMAEGFYNHFASGAISAGLENTPYTNPTKEVIEIMKEVGIDISAQTVQPLTQELIDQSEKVMLLCPEESELIKENTDHIIRHPFKDPFFTTIDEMRDIRDDIRNYVLSLL